MADEFELFSSLRYDPALPQASASGLDHAGWNRENCSPFYMLDFHRDRMLRAAAHWGWEKAIEVLRGDTGLKRLEDFLLRNVGAEQVLKRVKVILSKDGELRCEVGSTIETGLRNLFPRGLPAPGESSSDVTLFPRKAPVFEVVIDSDQTLPSEYTHFKTTKREMYDSARQRAGVSMTDAREVLLVNDKDSLVMEGTLTTPYFWRNGRWVTPPVGEHFKLGFDNGGQDGTTRRWALKTGLVTEEEVRADSIIDGEECWLSNGVKGFMLGKLRR